MITKTKTDIRIKRKDWEKMKDNPLFNETVELLEDLTDLKNAKLIKGKDLTLRQYLKNRELRDNN
ncbi:MAG: hypothetical protein KJ666_00540 [Bacteroidetes bacterium]|nr:hypothetical protein [Bacteroidota bacterium]MBU2584872.1 hypothetical protein [Bacteroidota bacterium]